MFDAMRGVAAIIVVIYHAGMIAGSRVWAPTGFIAVDFFFVLSGYVIAQAYETRFSAGLTLSRFFISRLIRLYPLALIGSLIGVSYILLSGTMAPEPLVGSTVFNLFLLPAPWTQVLFPVNTPVWSLFLELFANAAIALFTFRLSVKALVLLICCALAAFLAEIYYHHQSDVGMAWANLGGGIIRVTYGFTCGQLLFRLFGDAGDRRPTKWSLIPLAMLVGLLSAPLSPHFALVRVAVSTILIAPSLVAISAQMDLPAPLSRVGALLGDLSYPLYAVHAPLILLGFYWFHPVELSFGAMILVILPILLVLAFLIARYLDTPIRHRLSVTMARRESAPPQYL